MIKNILALLLCLIFSWGSLDAAYTAVYSINTNGGITWTGNTLGLNKIANQNNPGTSGAIGAFISLDSSLQVGSYPTGTTLNWALNSSSAVLDIPSGSTVLHAELVWSGSYGFDSSITNDDNLASNATTNTPITFITPDSVSHTITPTLAKSRVNSGTNGFYVRSADVTSFVQASGAGTYAAGGVPGTVISSENNLNCAGWTLCVAYSNPQMLTSNLTLFVSCEASGASPSSVTGFHAPDIGSISGRLFVSALEGDAQITGDQFLVGDTAILASPADRVSGSNNPANNFFASQINTVLNLTTDITTGKLVGSGSSVLDTRGTFGSTNSDAAAGTGTLGARQGYDITSIDIGSMITNSQEVIYAQGTTTGDVYTVNALGLQLQVKSPAILSTKEASATTAVVNDVITYTITFENVGELLAESLVFTDELPTGMELVSQSFTVNGTPVLSPDLSGGVSIGDLAINDTITIVFEVTVTSSETSYVNSGLVTYTFTPEGESPPPSVNISSQTNEVTITAPTAPAPVANPDTESTSANVTLNGTAVLENDTGSSISVSTYDNTSTEGGSVTMDSTGVYTYAPPTNFSGIDTFTYTIIDSLEQTSTATVTITVYPTAVSDTNSVASNTLLNGSSVLTNDFGSGLTVTAFDETSTHGGAVNVLSNGTYTYTSALNFSGIDSFTYTVTDANGNTSVASVTITVFPVADNDTGVTSANTPLDGSTVFTNDIGVGLVISAYDSVSVRGGTVLMNTTDGTYTYTPGTNISGLDTFTYTVEDEEGNTTVATVTITVLPLAVADTGITSVNTNLNGASVLTNDLGTELSVLTNDTSSIQGGTITMSSDGTYVYQPPENFSGTDTFSYTLQDVAGNESTTTVTITIEPDALNDTAITHSNTTLIGSSVLSNDGGTVLTVDAFQNPSTEGGTVSVNTNGTYTYIPPLNFSGLDTFEYTAKDSLGQTTVGTVTITVLPVGANDNVETPVNTPLIGSSVLANDAGSGLYITSYDATSLHGGTVQMNEDGTYVYTPATNFVGVDTFTYTAEDSSGNTFTATVTIDVQRLIAPDVFDGLLKKCEMLNRTQYFLNTVWTASPSPSVVAYEIYLDGTLVGKVSATASLKYRVCLPSKSFATRVEIAAIDSYDSRSLFKTVRIIHE